MTSPLLATIDGDYERRGVLAERILAGGPVHWATFENGRGPSLVTDRYVDLIEPLGATVRQSDPPPSFELVP